MSTRRRSAGIIAAMLVVTAGFVGLAGLPTMAGAAEPPVSLSLVPSGQPAGYFDLTMSAGSARQLSVQLVDGGADAIDARLYTAEAYTLLNGGFGVETSDAPRDGVTTWLDLPVGVRRLVPGATMETFRVTVPTGTTPGDYIAGLVLENATPVSEPGAGSLAQTIRTAIAVSIRVPGAMHPAIQVGAVTRTTVGDHSVLDVGVSNTGNARVAPRAAITLKDHEGRTVWSHTVQLGSIYAGTNTELEAALPASLAAGRYTMGVTLADPARNLRSKHASSSITIPGVAASTMRDPFAQGGRSLAFDLTGLALVLLILGAAVAIILTERAKLKWGES